MIYLIALPEAHESGLCAVSAEAKRAFGNDLLNLVFASPDLNRFEKADLDA
ncbi:MAG: hypothetical protein OXH85_10710 [Truepera sp.]|nr:hypothetical protein [Truepera sp.]